MIKKCCKDFQKHNFLSLYRNINFLDFYIKYNSGDPEQGARDGFGGDLFKYRYEVESYDPVTGKQTKIYPARQYMKAYVAHWMEYYRIDGLRLDSVNHIDNYDFLGEIKSFSRSLWCERGGREDQFLVVGEDLSVPISRGKQHRLDGMWNVQFKQGIRQVILGRSAPGETSTNLFLIHEGLKIQVFRNDDGWSEIKMPDGNAGWMKDAELEII